MRSPRETKLVVEWLTARTDGTVPVSTALPANATVPWYVVTVVSNPLAGGDMLSTIVNVQVDCYGPDKSTAQGLAQELRDLALAETGWSSSWGRIGGGVNVLGSLDMSAIEEGLGRWTVTLMLFAHPIDVDVS